MYNVDYVIVKDLKQASGLFEIYLMNICLQVYFRKRTKSVNVFFFCCKVGHFNMGGGGVYGVSSQKGALGVFFFRKVTFYQLNLGGGISKSAQDFYENTVVLCRIII